MALLGLEPPRPGASRTERLAFVRNLQPRALVPSVAMFISVVVVVAETWAMALVGAALLLLVADAA